MKVIAFSSMIAGFLLAINSNDFAYALSNQKTNDILGSDQLKLVKNKPIYLAQSTGLYGCWALSYSSAGVIHKSYLRMNGSDGLMVTTFFDQAINSTAYVKQTMQLKNSSKGLVILGYNPVNVETGGSLPLYSPDNFLYQVSPDGSQVFGTCDDAGKCSPVDLESCPES